MDDFAFVYANVTGSAFVGQAGYALPATASDLTVVSNLTVLGTVTAASFAGDGAQLTGVSQCDTPSGCVGNFTVKGATGMITTSFDPYIQPLVFGGMTIASTVASLWASRKRGILTKLAIATVLVMATVWAASVTVSTDANAFRWVAVVVTAGWTILVLYSLKGRGVRR